MVDVAQVQSNAWFNADNSTAYNASLAGGATARITFTGTKTNVWNGLVVTNASSAAVEVHLNGDITLTYAIPAGQTLWLSPPMDMVGFAFLDVKNRTQNTTAAASEITFIAQYLKRGAFENAVL